MFCSFNFAISWPHSNGYIRRARPLGYCIVGLLPRRWMEKGPCELLLSIVIPTLDAATDLEACLDALKEGQKSAVDSAVNAPEMEIIIADDQLEDVINALLNNIGDFNF